MLSLGTKRSCMSLLVASSMKTNNVQGCLAARTSGDRCRRSGSAHRSSRAAVGAGGRFFVECVTVEIFGHHPSPQCLLADPELMLVQQHLGRRVCPKSAYLVLTRSTAYLRMPSLRLRFEVRPRALWISPDPPSTSYLPTTGKPGARSRPTRLLPQPRFDGQSARRSIILSVSDRARSSISIPSLEPDSSNGLDHDISNEPLQIHCT